MLQNRTQTTNPYAAPNTEPIAAEPASLLVLTLGSLAVMLPWPLIGIGLNYRMFDQPSEGIFFFGGFTLLATLPLMLVGVDLGDTACSIIMIVGWVAAFLIPPAILVRKPRSYRLLASMLLLQSAFAMSQAAMGFLLILGKSC